MVFKAELYSVSKHYLLINANSCFIYAKFSLQIFNYILKKLDSINFKNNFFFYKFSFMRRLPPSLKVFGGSVAIPSLLFIPLY